MKFKIQATIYALLLSGCNTQLYKEPLSGDIANVRFVSTFETVAILRSYGDSSCKSPENEVLRTRNGFLLSDKHNSLGIPGGNKYRKEAFQEVRVQSSRPNHYMYFGDNRIGNSVYRCAVPFSVSFETGKNYEVKFLYEGSLSCSVKVSEISNSGDVKLVSNHYNRATPQTSACIARFNEERLF